MKHTSGSSLLTLGILLAGDRSYPSFAAFCGRMHDLGYRDGQNIRFVSRFAEGRLAELPALAAELVEGGAQLIAVVGAVTFFAVRKVAPEVPVVFSIVLDPVEAGLVKDAMRPGGHATGSTSFDPGQTAAQIRLLTMAVPGLKRLAILGDAGVPAILPKLARAAAEAAGIEPHVFLLGSEADLAPAFREFADRGAEALLCLEVPRTTTYGAEIVAMANAARLPAIFGRDHARYRPLLAYGTSLAAAAARMAAQADAVLKGADPGELPIEYVAAPELVIDVGVAERLRLELAPELVACAAQLLR